MSEMVERVARAIYAAAERRGEYVGDYEFHSYGGAEPAGTTLDGQFDIKALARAAIEAMDKRDSPEIEVTDAMVSAALAALWKYKWISDPCHISYDIMRDILTSALSKRAAETI